MNTATHPIVAGLVLAAVAGTGFAGEMASEYSATNQPTRIPVIAASEMIGAPLRTTDWKTGGEIEYVLISKQGKATHALIDDGGDLKLPGKMDALAVVPFHLLDPVGADPYVDVEARMETLAGAITIDEDRINELSDSTVLTRIRDYYISVGDDAANYDAMASNGGGSIGEAVADKKDRIAEDEGFRLDSSILVGSHVVATVLPGVKAAANVEGAEVLNANRERFGEIEELVLNVDTGEVAYVLVANGGFLGIGETWYPVPLAALTWNVYENAYVADESLADIDERPQLSRDALPTRVWSDELDAFYESFGIDPDERVSQNVRVQ